MAPTATLVAPSRSKRVHGPFSVASDDVNHSLRLMPTHRAGLTTEARPPRPRTESGQYDGAVQAPHLPSDARIRAGNTRPPRKGSNQHTVVLRTKSPFAEAAISIHGRTPALIHACMPACRRACMHACCQRCLHATAKEGSFLGATSQRALVLFDFGRNGAYQHGGQTWRRRCERGRGSCRVQHNDRHGRRTERMRTMIDHTTV